MVKSLTQARCAITFGPKLFVAVALELPFHPGFSGRTGRYFAAAARHRRSTAWCTKASI